MPCVADCVRLASLWEVCARKAGNVHLSADFADLDYNEFVRSGEAIAPVLERLQREPIGITILDAIRATRAVVSTNTNLGIVLLLVPLSKANSQRALCDLLDRTTIDDARHVYEAIRLAVPGGMGRVKDQDIAETPTQTLREVMALASDRDMIARQYASGFRDVFEEGVPALLRGGEQFHSVEAGILTCQLHWLSRFPDSLIVRKCGMETARQVQQRAQAIEQVGGLATPQGRQLYADLDRWLRGDGHSRNPGTTADLVTACLFVALRDRRMKEEMPFHFPDYSP